jgi:hypothetical protein
MAGYLEGLTSLDFNRETEMKEGGMDWRRIKRLEFLAFYLSERDE